MGKNYMEEVAKLLEVEVGEVFEIYVGGECQGCCRFTKDRVEVLDNHCWYRTKTETLEWLLNGTATIVKLPWKPQKGEQYYTPCIATQPKYMFSAYYWNDSVFDEEHYRMGLVRKTKEEAVALTKKMLSAAKEVKNND